MRDDILLRAKAAPWEMTDWIRHQKLVLHTELLNGVNDESLLFSTVSRM